jgi:signal transduction histidine kinase
MTWTAQDRIKAGFWVLPFIPVLLFFMALRTTSSLIESADDVKHTNVVQLRLQELLATLNDLEVGQREFVLTGSDDYLKPYYDKKKSIANQIGTLETLTSDNERQRRSIASLKDLVPQKFDEMEKTIELRRREGYEAASKIVINQRGEKAMDDMKNVIKNMATREEELLQERSAIQYKSFVKTIAILAAVLMLNILFVGALWFLIRRETAERKREEQKIRELNAELEQRVEQRTEALRRSNDDLQQFAYVASHDLQEPLRMVASYTELLQRRYETKLDADADQYIHFAVDGVKRMSMLIRDLLEYSRAGQAPEESLQIVDSEETLVTVLENLKFGIGETGAQVTHDPLPPVRFEGLRLSQIFQNLIGNALKYRGDKSPLIHISAREDGRDVVFSVRDNGIGIDPKYSSQIFGIFKRLHGYEYEGTGIGLAMCKKIVERYGGKIWVDSQVGEGSTFSFTIRNNKAARAANVA